MSRYFFGEEQRLNELVDALDREGYDFDDGYGTTRAYAVGVFLRGNTYIIEVPTSNNMPWYMTDDYNEMEEYPRDIDGVLQILERLA